MLAVWKCPFFLLDIHEIPWTSLSIGMEIPQCAETGQCMNQLVKQIMVINNCFPQVNYTYDKTVVTQQQKINPVQFTWF